MKQGFAFLAAILFAVTTATTAAAQDGKERVVIRTAKPYSKVVATIQSVGGVVTHQFKYFDAIAAEVPQSALGQLRAMVGAAAVTKDIEIPAPKSVDVPAQKGDMVPFTDGLDIPYDRVDALDAASLSQLTTADPTGYSLNSSIANLGPLQAAGIYGQGMVVAVIDSGIRPGFPHISLDGSVVACDDFVGDALGCSNFANNGHGTFVAGMISANVTFILAGNFLNAIKTECPSCVTGSNRVAMVGTAPLSSIYALRVFGPTGGAPTSRILAAIDRVIALKTAFQNGEPGGVDIKVVNMSLGGSTINAGRDVFDLAVDQLLAHDIIPVIAASNSGPSSITVGSPGTSHGAVTVGAASLPHNERILRDLQYGLGIGSLYRPFGQAQMAYFSARGPNADGQIDPDVVANGFANFGQGLGSTTNSISIGSGTSFATPSVAGIAAVLRQAYPAASATQVRNAIIAGANPSLLSDGSTAIDQGHGYVDAGAAAALLASGEVPNVLPPSPNAVGSVMVNVERESGLKVSNGFVRESIGPLKPGQRHDILYRVAPNTKQVVIALGNVTPTNPPSGQNQLFGDDILLAVHSAKTSAIGEGDYRVFAFTLGGTWVLDNPEEGLIRITVNGDWTNAGTIAAEAAVFSTTEALPQLSAQGTLVDGNMAVYPVNIPAGVKVAEFRAGWREGWGSYPANDLDLILISPTNQVIFTGATLNSPELAVVKNPAAGKWTAIVDGFEIHTPFDKYELRVSLDGKVLK